MSTLQQRQQADDAASGPGRGGALVLPGLREGLVLPSLPGALCKGEDPGPWFPPGAGRFSAEAAKAVCAACPARVRCLEWALEVNEAEGVWGGTTPAERAEMRRAGRRGASGCLEGLARPGLAGRT
jgi:WhiB family transcriptional regulator, redox-sensing transcriptional regulator